MIAIKNLFFTIAFTGIVSQPTVAQKIKLGEALIIKSPILKESADTAAFESHVMNDVIPAWSVLGDSLSVHLFRADRASPTSLSPVGSYWILWNIATKKQRNSMLPSGRDWGFSPDILKKIGRKSFLSSQYLSDSGGFTDYRLVGGDSITEMPEVELLGAHFIKVKEERKEEFDEFIRDALHPALVNKLYGLNLLYYKAINGPDKGQYLTFFAIESVAAREYYWPTGSPETKALKVAFKPLIALARQLEDYLVPDSYLKAESGAAAAIFESLNWTDFALLK